MNICVYGAASSSIDQVYIDTVYELCVKLAKRGHNLVFGAGDSGLMGAAARGFKDGGGSVTGVAPTFFREGFVEKVYEYCDNLVFTDSMGTRKSVMEANADAYIVCPGGVGTFDEFFQVLTLKDLCIHNSPIALFNIKGYYYSIQALLHNGAEEGFLRGKCLSLYECFDENHTDELIAYLEKEPEPLEGIVNDYKVQ